MKNFLLILSVFTLSFSKIILTEIMYDPSGSEHHDEFIEIYNNSQDSIDLNGWSVSDNDERDMLIRYNGAVNMILPPESFCVIMDSSYYLNSTEYEELIPDTVLRIMINDGSIGKYGLSNSYPETVSIIDNNSVTSDSATYTLDQESGYSEERKLFTADDWENSVILKGTPGFRNSVMPFDNDIEITEISIPEIDPEVYNSFTVTVMNTGMNTFNDFSLNIYIDGIIYSHELFTNDLMPDDDVIIDAEIFFEISGTVELKFELEADTDDDISDNFYYTDVFVPYQKSPLLLNEFMKVPGPGQCEYVEIVNVSEDSIFLGDFGISDEVIENVIFMPDTFLEPSGFFVIAKDSSIFNFNNVINSNISVNSSLASLNNSGDTVHLLSKDMTISDNIYYGDSFDDDDGKSIEKINPDFNSSDPANWALCVESGTPTQKNSVYQESEDIGSGSKIIINPRTATPNGDGKNDKLFITYEFDSSWIFVTVKIFNIKGQLISKPFNGEYKSSKGTLVWNCLTEEGSVADTGAYICLIEVKDDNDKIIELKEPFYIAK